MTRLATLLPDTACPGALGVIEVCGIAADSRRVEPGWVFFAVPGNKTDGLGFLAEAIARGAVAIVAERQPAEPTSAGVAFILVTDVRTALARAASAFFPRQPAIVAAVTGTSGKTSVAAFCRQIWTQAGVQAASLGTLGVVAPAGALYGALTTPDTLALHATLDELAGAGVTHLALEASSHGIEQKRLDGVRLAAAAFTNLSHDHLDYHGTMDEYLAAKLRLFEALLPTGAPAVVNADSDVAARVIAACTPRGLPVISVGSAGQQLRVVAAESDGLAMALTLDVEGRRMQTRLPLAGGFQVSNALVAAGLCMATGTPAEVAIAALAQLEGAPGRLQLAGRRGTAPVFIDYAHKPDALQHVLTTLRPLVGRRLVVVFGCGGDRDRAKRAVMGEIAGRLADHVVVTDDNPRSEQPDAIRREILAGMGTTATIAEIGDRAEAIESAVAGLEDGDVLVIAGKGHETGQILVNRVVPFSDLDCATQALQNHPR